MKQLCPTCELGELWVGCANPVCGAAGPAVILVGLVGTQVKTYPAKTCTFWPDHVTHQRRTIRFPNGLIWLWVPIEYKGRKRVEPAGQSRRHPSGSP